jgi:hypothetical protein
MNFTSMLGSGLHSRHGLVRKGSALLLQQGPKRMARCLKARSSVEQYTLHPPVLANSFPKSGTHLLDQIVAGLPGRVNYGEFLSSMTSSFQLRPRSPESTRRCIRRSLPGEIIRAHLFYHSSHDEELQRLNFVHYFIYRDPRDVVVSASHYLRHMNPWHRMSRTFRALPSDEDGILLSIEGLPDDGRPARLPSVAVRFRWYAGWLDSPHVCAMRFEWLVGPERDKQLERIVDFYASRTTTPVDRQATLENVRAQIAPEKSHTYRKDKGGGWREAFTPRLKDAFKRVAGDLLIRLGYERDNSW